MSTTEQKKVNNLRKDILKATQKARKTKNENDAQKVENIRKAMDELFEEIMKPVRSNDPEVNPLRIAASRGKGKTNIFEYEPKVTRRGNFRISFLMNGPIRGEPNRHEYFRANEIVPLVDRIREELKEFLAPESENDSPGEVLHWHPKKGLAVVEVTWLDTSTYHRMKERQNIKKTQVKYKPKPKEEKQLKQSWADEVEAERSDDEL